MKINQLAQESGLSIDTIRFYEKKGLLDGSCVCRLSNNYRDYSEQSLERLQFIQQAKQLGFTLVEIQEWLDGLHSDRMTHAERREILYRRVETIDRQINDLQMAKQTIFACIEKFRD